MMEDYRKKSEEELFAIQRNSVIPGPIYEVVTQEIQRRQQENNTNQISTLIKEIAELKNITYKSAETATRNAASANSLVRVAIFIAIASLITQILFSAHQRVRCGSSYTSNTEPVYYTDCYRSFDLGLFSERTYKIPDIVVPKEPR